MQSILERAEQLSALCDELRIQIVDTLSTDSMTTGELCEALEAERYQVQYRLQALEKAGIIESKPAYTRIDRANSSNGMKLWKLTENGRKLYSSLISENIVHSEFPDIHDYKGTVLLFLGVISISMLSTITQPPSPLWIIPITLLAWGAEHLHHRIHKLHIPIVGR